MGLGSEIRTVARTVVQGKADGSLEATADTLVDTDFEEAGETLTRPSPY